MTDAHLRILRRVACETQRALDAHDHRSDDAGATVRRRRLTSAAGRTRARVTAAEARRQHYERSHRGF